MTEADAKTRWCFLATAPLETSGVGIGIAINRNPDGTPHPATLCLGSGCMAWRWKDVAEGYPPEGFCGDAGTKGVEMTNPAPPPARAPG